MIPFHVTIALPLPTKDEFVELDFVELEWFVCLCIELYRTWTNIPTEPIFAGAIAVMPSFDLIVPANPDISIIVFPAHSAGISGKNVIIAIWVIFYTDNPIANLELRHRRHRPQLRIRQPRLRRGTECRFRSPFLRLQ